ncbi:DUF4238 domain-containing protein [Rhodopirellula baltica]
MAKQNETENQHTVPAVFLKAFASDGNLTRKGKILQYSRETSNCKELSIGKQASTQDGIYTLQDHPEKTRMFLETTLFANKIENDAGAPLSKLRSGQPVSGDDRVAISAFFALQCLRTKARIEDVHAQDAELFKPENMIRYVQLNREKLNNLQGRDAVDEEISRIRNTGEVAGRSRSRRLLELFNSNLGGLTECIWSLNWRVERASKGTAFVTSDNPVFVRHRSRPLKLAHVCLDPEDSDVELYVAISPERFLIGSWNPESGSTHPKATISHTRVEHLNRLTVVMADQFVFASKRCKQVERLLAQERNSRVQWPDLVSALLSG